MATLTVSTAPGRAGLDLTATAVAASGGGDKFPNTGLEQLWVNNGSGAPITVTLTIQTTVDGKAVTNPTVSVPAGHGMVIGPFPTNWYNDGNGNMNMTYSGVTSLTVLPFRPSTN